MGRLPRVSNPALLEVVPVALFVLKFNFELPVLVEIVLVALFVLGFDLVLKHESNVCELDSPEVPTLDVERAPGLLVLLYLKPGTPGLVGSSRLLGFLERITTTRCIVGRKFGSPCVHSKPI